MSGFRRILHPTDFSDSSVAARSKAIELAKVFEAELVFLHVYADPSLYPEAVAIPDPFPELEEQLQQIARVDGVRTSAALEVGSAAETILRSAESLECDLIVMGTHGRTGLKHMVLGSVAERIVRRSTCPVLTVRQPNSIPPEEFEGVGKVHA